MTLILSNGKESKMEEAKRVLCAGIVFVDILMNGVEELPSHWEQTLLAEEACLGIGGGGANSAKTFGILGETCDFLGRVGEDKFGILVEKELQSCQVETSLLVKDDKNATGVAAGLVHKDGKRCFITARGANRELCKDDFANVDINRYDFLHINGYFQFPKLETDLREVMEEFKRCGAKITFDTASWDPSGRWYESIKLFVDCIDYLFLNDAQIIRLTEKEDVETSAQFLLEKGVANVVAKLGEKGCALFKKDTDPIYIPTAKYSVCDTSGAGDSFDAAFIVGLKHGWDEIRCAEFANTVAGLNCCRVGSTAGVPDFCTAHKKMKEIYG